MPKRHGKKYQEALKKVEEALGQNGDAGLEPKKAVEVARDTSTAKFDATVEAHVRLGRLQAAVAVARNRRLDLLGRLDVSLSSLLRHYSTTSRPIERAVPSIIFIACSSS